MILKPDYNLDIANPLVDPRSKKTKNISINTSAMKSHKQTSEEAVKETLAITNVPFRNKGGRRRSQPFNRVRKEQNMQAQKSIEEKQPTQYSKLQLSQIEFMTRNTSSHYEDGFTLPNLSITQANTQNKINKRRNLVRSSSMPEFSIRDFRKANKIIKQQKGSGWVNSPARKSIKNISEGMVYSELD